MPATARSYGLAKAFDADQAIEAQAHLMRDVLRDFGDVPLALAAYSAGPAAVRACMCVPGIPETRAYVANILGLLNGAGDPLGAAATGLEVRVVR
jgi:soluble lytic murein transglycosylase-like protein